jgi:excisionase family DNA binding protein
VHVPQVNPPDRESGDTRRKEKPVPQEEPSSPFRKLLTIPEAAAALRVGRTTVYELFKSGLLGSVQVAGRRFVAVAEIDRFIADNTQVSA